MLASLFQVIKKGVVMATKAEFDVPPDCMSFLTFTNGDHIEIGPHNRPPVHIGSEAAANLASLINTGDILTVIIKKKET